MSSASKSRKSLPEDFLPRSANDPEVMLAELQAILRAIKNPHLLALAEACFADDDMMRLLKQAPGAKTIHHPYLSGLLEHTLSLLKLILKVVENYRGVDVDMLLIGGFLHDIGKIYEFTFDRALRLHRCRPTARPSGHGSRAGDPED